MSAAVKTAGRWSCARCGVSVSRLDGAQTPFPENWTRGSEGNFCLICRRERAAEAVLEGAPADCSHDTRAKLRRSGLVEFEVRRAPERADSAIAKSCRTSASVVVAARKAVGRR